MSEGGGGGVTISNAVGPFFGVVPPIIILEVPWSMHLLCFISHVCTHS